MKSVHISIPLFPREYCNRYKSVHISIPFYYSLGNIAIDMKSVYISIPLFPREYCNDLKSRLIFIDIYFQAVIFSKFEAKLSKQFDKRITSGLLLSKQNKKQLLNIHPTSVAANHQKLLKYWI